MARPKGGDSITPKKGAKTRPRQVYVFTEGKVTEPEYIDIVLRNGVPEKPGRTVQHHIENPTGEGKLRKPLRMVQDAVRTRRKVEREAKAAGLKPPQVDDGGEKGDWNWPQVWVLFDRDDHPDIQQAMQEADKEGIRVAYSFPCFELWRLLHYTNYTSTFGKGSCGTANSRLRSCPGFAATYGRGVRTVSEQESKHMREEQVLSKDGERYFNAKKYAQAINKRAQSPDPNDWDPYTDVWCFVEEGLLLSHY
ncbi:MULTISPECIES: RloB family protein [unclassified Streptomyces]|uniref:RloB family protein n=1 Tax=unclassified Streptomyces TaxID=2593676 RepID=UPI000DD8E89B|nr:MULTISPECIES: RloB family protein [unclassified Streptomyces]QZZ29253.1 RloB domain-containing protein [Streptomyces sp. ST1015]